MLVRVLNDCRFFLTDCCVFHVGGSQAERSPLECREVYLLVLGKNVAIRLGLWLERGWCGDKDGS